MNKFIVAISGGNRFIRNAITNHVKTRFAYWHWMPDLWLLKTDRPVNAEQIRDAMMKLAPGVNVFVTPVASPPDGMNWAMYAPEEWGEWLNKNWT
jgi:hypothetical protein